MKLAAGGTSYVGVSLAVVLAKRNEVIALNIIPGRVAMLNRLQSPMPDEGIQNNLSNQTLRFKSTFDSEEDHFFNSKNVKNLSTFKQLSDVIVTNRKAPELNDVSQKYIRVIYLGAIR